jgi:hypothetical protein
MKKTFTIVWAKPLLIMPPASPAKSKAPSLFGSAGALQNGHITSAGSNSRSLVQCLVSERPPLQEG